MSYVAEPLGDHHHLDDFDCGNDALNDWLRRHARTASGQGTRTYVVIDVDGEVVGYFAVAPHTIDRETLPRSVSRVAPNQIPAVLLAKLALDSRLHAQGLGSELLAVALGTIVDAARRVGGKFVVVDAIDDSAAAFYAHHEFIAVPSDPRRFVRKLSTIAKALGEPWP